MIYLEQDGDWRVTKVMDLHDTLYWDPAFDLAMLKYPPFGSHRPGAWAAFLAAYGPEPPERRLLLCLLIQRIDAGLGNYMEPQAVASVEWVRSSMEELPDLLAALGS